MKKINGFLIFGIVITLGLLVYLLVVPKPQELDYTQYATEQWQNDKKDVLGEEEVAKQEEKEQKLKDLYQVKIENETELYSQYTGELVVTTATNKIRELVLTGFQKLYDATKVMNQTQLNQYFEQNKKDIAMQTGLTTADQFASLIQKLQIYRDSIEYTKVELEKDSYQNGDKYANFKIKITYNNDKTLELTVYISYKDFSDTPIVIIQ